MHYRKVIIVFTTILLLTPILNANVNTTKQAIKCNYQRIYTKKQESVDTFNTMFSEGKLYGRLRSNTFYYRWDNDDASHDTHLISGLGASLVYKSATLNDLDFTTGLYFSQALYNASSDPYNMLKPGKDVLSRYDYANTGHKYMGVLGEAYLRYSGIRSTEIKLGRQIVETFYTKSNDSKMIPNTFDGVVISTKALPDTSLNLAYLFEQKLRDHTKAHSVLMYGDANSTANTNPQYSENDDSAMHRGLTYSALIAAGKPTDSPLIVADFKNNSIENLKIDASTYIVPELISQVMGELNYKFKLTGKLSMTPGVRYIKQFDNGAGAVGGASLTGNSTGYKDANSLNSQMIAARLVAKIEDYKINLGYSQVFDESDLITPWRGFPTAGYTRSMARYNWRANTKSYRLEIMKNKNKKGVYKNLFTQASILYTNEDEAKIGSSDEMYYYLGFIQNIPSFVDLQWRLRLGYTQYLNSDDSRFNNLDSRFELNYLF